MFQTSVKCRKHSKPIIALHWIMFVAILAAYALIEFRVLYEKGSLERELMKTMHFMMGLFVLILVIIRIIAKVLDLKSFRDQGVTLKSVGHFFLYVFMVTMPILGWLYLSLAGKPVVFFGFEVPELAQVDKVFAKEVKKAHEMLGALGYWLLGGHVAFAFWHEFFIKDRIFQRISPKQLFKTNSNKN